MIFPILSIGINCYLFHFLSTGQKIPSRKILYSTNLMTFIQQIFVFIVLITFYINPWTEGMTSTPTYQICQALLYSNVYILIGALIEVNLAIASIFSIILFPNLKKSVLRRVAFGVWTYLVANVIYNLITTILYFVWQVESQNIYDVPGWKSVNMVADYILVISCTLAIIYNLLKALAICKTIMAWKKNSSSPEVFQLYNQVIWWIYFVVGCGVLAMGVGFGIVIADLPPSHPLVAIILAFSAGFFPTLILLGKVKEFVYIKRLTFTGIRLKGKLKSVHVQFQTMKDTLPTPVDVD